MIVDFWAPWCGPCKTAGPALEKAVNDAKGAVSLVKVNIDENPEIAQQLRIQSIPTVYAFKNGQPVDGFMGAIPESQVKTFVAHLGGRCRAAMAGADHAAEVLAIADEAFAAGDIATAAQAYGHVLQDDAGPSQGGGGPRRVLSEKRRSGARQHHLAAGAARRCCRRRRSAPWKPNSNCARIRAPPRRRSKC